MVAIAFLLRGDYYRCVSVMTNAATPHSRSGRFPVYQGERQEVSFDIFTQNGREKLYTEDAQIPCFLSVKRQIQSHLLSRKLYTNSLTLPTRSGIMIPIQAAAEWPQASWRQRNRLRRTPDRLPWPTVSTVRNHLEPPTQFRTTFDGDTQ
jgi:hypothetical protein